MAVTVDDILEARDLSEPRISPDGHWVALVISDASGSYVHLISLVDGTMRSVSDEPVRGGRGLGGGCFDWLPDSTGLVVVTKDNGSRRRGSDRTWCTIVHLSSYGVGSFRVHTRG